MCLPTALLRTTRLVNYIRDTTPRTTATYALTEATNHDMHGRTACGLRLASDGKPTTNRPSPVMSVSH